MADQTLTFALNGDVPLPLFASAMQHFNSLVDNLSAEIAGNEKIEWVIDELESGSAIATVKGVSDNVGALSAIIDAYLVVGRALQKNAPIPYSERVSRPAREISKILNGKITSVRFETPHEDIVISGHYEEGKQPTRAIGSIKGVVESLSRRRGIRFTIYDSVTDRPISCYLGRGEENKIKDFWGKKVLVSGVVSRDADTGKPFAIRGITDVQLVKSSAPGSYRNARGILQLNDGDTASSVIRRLRDA